MTNNHGVKYFPKLLIKACSFHVLAFCPMLTEVNFILTWLNNLMGQVRDWHQWQEVSFALKSSSLDILYYNNVSPAWFKYCGGPFLHSQHRQESKGIAKSMCDETLNKILH